MNITETIVPMEDLMPLIQEVLSKGQDVHISPKGVSMLPMLRQGIDSVVLSPITKELRKYDIPLYRRDNGKYVLHRIVDVGNGYTCIGDNQFSPEPNLRHEQMIAVVTAFYRGNKKYSTSSLAYWLYCRAWHYSRGFRRFYRRAIRWILRHIK